MAAPVQPGGVVATVAPSQEVGLSPSQNVTENEPRNRWSQKLELLHSRIPLIKRLPFNAVGIITVLVLFQFGAWIIAGLVLHDHPQLIGTAAIAWTLGLRHALDADHISCIDLMARRLIASGQKPVSVGTFFSLGHSTIVIITCIVVAATSSAAAQHFNDFSRIGGIIGSSVSAAFLVLLGVMNVFILARLIQQLRILMETPPGQEPETQLLDKGSFLFGLIERLFKVVNRPWKMYPVGVLFGLGFDTSSEVALLGISALQASKGTSLWFILIFPFLFTSGMCLVDTIDGALMMSLYTSATGSRDPFVVTYYSLVLTGITVVVAMFIGIVQALQLADAVIPDPEGPFWNGVEALGNAYDIIGASICGCFIFFGALSVVCFKPWRRWVEKKRTTKFLERIDEAAISRNDPLADDIEGAGSSNVVQSVHVQAKGKAQDLD